MHNTNDDPPSIPCKSLPVLEIEEEAKKAAKEFFSEAYTKALSTVHSIKIEKNILFYDYIGAYEISEERVSKVLSFLSSLELGKIGAQAQKEFYEELEQQEDEDLGDDDNHDPDNNVELEEAFDDNGLQNIMQD